MNISLSDISVYFNSNLFDIFVYLNSNLSDISVYFRRFLLIALWIFRRPRSLGPF